MVVTARLVRLGFLLLLRLVSPLIVRDARIVSNGALGLLIYDYRRSIFLKLGMDVLKIGIRSKCIIK